MSSTEDDQNTGSTEWVEKDHNKRDSDDEGESMRITTPVKAKEQEVIDSSDDETEASPVPEVTRERSPTGASVNDGWQRFDGSVEPPLSTVDLAPEGKSEESKSVEGGNNKSPVSPPSPVAAPAVSIDLSPEPQTRRGWYPGKFIGLKPRNSIGGDRSMSFSSVPSSSASASTSQVHYSEASAAIASGSSRQSVSSAADAVKVDSSSPAPTERRRSWGFRVFGNNNPPPPDSSPTPASIVTPTTDSTNTSNTTSTDPSSTTSASNIDTTNIDIEKDNAEENSSTTREESRNESMIVYVAKSIRQKFLMRKLVGRIYLYRISGVISTAMTLDIRPIDIERHILDSHNHVDIDIAKVELTGHYSRALSVTDTILNSLERRSRAWKNCDFMTDCVMITRGTTIGVSDPFLGIVGWSFTMELSATVASLIQSRDRFEVARDLAISTRETIALQQQQAMRESESLSGKGTARSSSFSFMRSFSRSSVSATNSTASTAPVTFTQAEVKTLQALHEEAAANEGRDSDEDEVIDDDSDDEPSPQDEEKKHIIV